MQRKLWNKDYILLLQGNAISLFPMLYICFHRDTKAFISTH